MEHRRPSWSYGALSGVSGSSWGSFGASWRPLGALWGALRPHGALLGRLGALLGPSWGSLGPLWGALLGAMERQLGPSWRQSIKRGVLYLGSLSGTIKVAYGGAFGAILGALGAVLGASWAPLRALWGQRGATWRPQERIGSEEAGRPKSLILPRFWKDFGLLGGSRGSSESTWGRLVALLGPLGGMLLAILSHVGLS